LRCYTILKQRCGVLGDDIILAFSLKTMIYSIQLKSGNNLLISNITDLFLKI